MLAVGLLLAATLTGLYGWHLWSYDRELPEYSAPSGGLMLLTDAPDLDVDVAVHVEDPTAARPSMEVTLRIADIPGKGSSAPKPRTVRWGLIASGDYRFGLACFDFGTIEPKTTTPVACPGVQEDHATRVARVTASQFKTDLAGMSGSFHIEGIYDPRSAVVAFGEVSSSPRSSEASAEPPTETFRLVKVSGVLRGPLARRSGGFELGAAPSIAPLNGGSGVEVTGTNGALPTVQTPPIEGLTFVGGHTVIFSVGGSRIGDTLTNTAPHADPVGYDVVWELPNGRLASYTWQRTNTIDQAYGDRRAFLGGLLLGLASTVIAAAAMNFIDRRGT